MAEIIGVVASGIAIGQATAAITVSLLKLKELWGELQNVPDDLTQLVREIEITYLVLAECDDRGQLVPLNMRSRALEGVLQLTNDAAGELKVLIGELQSRVSQNKGWKKKLATAKAVLERDQIKRHKSRLKRCIHLLLVAQNWKILAMLERQPALLSAQLTEMTRKAHISDIANTMGEHGDNTTRRASNSKEDVMFRIRMSLFRQQWHFYNSRSQTGWNFGFRVFRIEPKPSHPHDYILHDDAVILRELFCCGKASPFTIFRENDGPELSFLAYSIGFGARKVCQLLLDEGAKVVEESINPRHSPLKVLAGDTYRVLTRSNGDKFEKQERMDWFSATVMNDPEHDVNPLEWFPAQSLFRSKLPLFQKFQTRLFPGYYNSPIQVRKKVALEIILQNLNSPDVFWEALGDFSASDLDQLILIEKPFSLRCTMLWLVASRFGRGIFEEKSTPSLRELSESLYTPTINHANQSNPSLVSVEEPSYPYCGWQAVVRQFLRRGIDANLQGDYGTPMIGVVVGAYNLDYKWDTTLCGPFFTKLSNILIVVYCRCMHGSRCSKYQA